MLNEIKIMGEMGTQQFKINERKFKLCMESVRGLVQDYISFVCPRPRAVQLNIANDVCVGVDGGSVL